LFSSLMRLMLDLIHNLVRLFWLLVLCFATGVQADWINLTGAETSPNITEIYVLDDRVRVVLEVYIEDLQAFDELIPEGWFTGKQPDRAPIEERLRQFADNRFQIVTDSGEKLPAELTVVEPRLRKDRFSPFAGMINPFTRQRVPESPADKRVLYAELNYPLKEKAQALTFVPPLDEEGRPIVTIGFITYHKSVPVIDFRYLGAPARLNLDWDDPWYSKFDNPNLRRHHKDALMSYLYVEPYEVRHEILTRVRDLEAWMDLGLRDRRYIEVDELGPLKQRIGEFLIRKNPVLIDGDSLKPILDRSNYIRVGLQGIQFIEKPERLETSTAIVGVIISYLTDGMPQQVNVDWELFTDQVLWVPATAADPAGPLMSYLTPDDNIHSWTNYLKNYELPTVQKLNVAGSLGEIDLPVVTLVCALLLIPVAGWAFRRRYVGGSLKIPLIAVLLLVAGGAIGYPFAKVPVARPTAIAGDLQPERAQQLLQLLLKNVYRAFDFREEEDVYDKLAISVSGDLLAEIYLQNRRSFAIKQAGGAQAKIKSIEILEAIAERVEGRPLAYAIEGRWSAQGMVGHWGHNHMRRNLYHALVTVEALDGAWKITDLELLEEKRVDPVVDGISSTPAADRPNRS